MTSKNTEKVGFEPTVELLPHNLSKIAPSATRTLLHFSQILAKVNLYAQLEPICYNSTMKKLTILSIIVLLFLSLAFNLRNYHSHKVLKIEDANCIFVDINNDGQISYDETVALYGIKAISKPKNYNQIMPAQDFALNYFQTKWLNDTLLNKKVKLIKQNKTEYKIYLNGKNISTEMLKQGLAQPNAPEYKKYKNSKAYFLELQNIHKQHYVILNTKTKKYHKLDCKFGQKSTSFILIPEKDLPKDSIECKYCHRHHHKKYKYKHKFHKHNHIEDFNDIGNIRLYFIDFKNIDKPNQKCTTQACKDLISNINSAKSAIDFAIYGINKQDAIFAALTKAQKRGVKIRWIVDNNSETLDFYPATLKLEKAIPTYKFNQQTSRKALMHNKFFVFDGQKVWSGSANITDTDFSLFNANYAVLINSKQIANIYTNKFNEMYGESSKAPINAQNKYLNVKFSPDDKIITTQLIPLIDSAKSYIYMPIFFLTHKELSKHLIQAKKRGVDVRVIIDATCAHQKFSIHKKLRSAGIKVKTENKAGKMHMKALIIDDKYCALGSMNFSKSGEDKNAENMIIIKDKNAAKYLKRTFLYMWASIPDKYLYKDPRAEAPESIGSCSDGIDNDFDGLIDRKDDACKNFVPYKQYVKLHRHKVHN